MDGCELSGELRGLLEGVAKAGSWAVWMGIFDKGWMRLLEKGGVSHSRARRLTTRLCHAIADCRAEIAKVRHERQREQREGTTAGAGPRAE